jgi:hypothetical protein
MSEITRTVLELATQAVKDEAGSRLCHLRDDGKRVCSREIASFCFCEDVASAALQAVRPFRRPLAAGDRRVTLMRAAKTQANYKHGMGGLPKGDGHKPKPITLPKMPWDRTP